MRKLRDRLSIGSDRESGLTLIEVVVAMMIFMVIATGVLYTMVNLLQVSRDGRSRQVASNLAAQEIDLARDIADIFKVGTVSRSPVVNGDTYTVTRKSEWVTNVANSGACGVGGGTLRYKKINVTVTWQGMKKGAAPVTTDTLINPKTRISDPDLGTILTSVTTASGAPVAGIPVSAVSSSGTALTSVNTDSSGCAYFLNVTPGQFTVSISTAAGDYVDLSGNTNPNQVVPVTKGTAASATFYFDKAGTLQTTYRVASAVTPLALETTFQSTRDAVVAVGPTSGITNPRANKVYPWPDGYTVLAGDTTQCAAHDPALWTASGTRLDGVAPDAVAVQSGVTTPVTVPMGAVTVKGMDTSTGSSSKRYLLAVSADKAGAGQPACAISQEYRFAAATSTTMTYSLPYGSWYLYRGTSTTFAASSGTLIGNSDLTNLTNSLGLNDLSLNSLVVLDPRAKL